MSERTFKIKTSTSARARSHFWWDCVSLMFLGVMVSVIYAKVGGAEFLFWDDDRNIFFNPQVTGQAFDLIWRAPYYGLYVPVTSSVWALLFSVGGGQTWPYHLLNLVLHLANVSMVYFLLCQFQQSFFETFRAARPSARKPFRFASWLTLADARLAPLLGATLFAVHPLQVGAVAWISGQRDLLATFFALLAVVFYFRIHHRAQSDVSALGSIAVPGRSYINVILFIFAMLLSELSKPSAAALPLALIAFEFMFRRHLLRRALEIQLAVIAISGVVFVLTWRAQELLLEPAPVWYLRPLIAVDALGFYLIKIFAPLSLAVDYGRKPAALIGHFQLWLPTTLAFGVAVMLLLFFSRRVPAFKVAWLWPILLLPVLGLLPFGFQSISTVADHYNYLPLLIVCCVLVVILNLGAPRQRRTLTSLSAIALVGMTWLSVVRLEVWESNRAFFENMAARNPNSYSAGIGLASVYCMSASEFQRGIDALHVSNRVRPFDLTALSDLAACLSAKGDSQAVNEMKSLLQNEVFTAQFNAIPQAAASFMGSVGVSYVQLGNLKAGFPYLCESAALDPEYVAYARNVERTAKVLESTGVEFKCPRGLTLSEFLKSVVSPPSP